MSAQQAGKRPLVVGAYPAHARSGDPGIRRDVLAGLAERAWVAGWEHPWVGGPLELPPQPRWAHVITPLPGTMQRVARDPWFGLASPEPDGRAAALAFAATLRDEVERAVAEGVRVQAVEVHSAPTRLGGPDAFRASLRALASWDWAGAALFVEHCDADTGSPRVEKGFLRAEAEVDAVAALRAEGTLTPLGFTVNWARSVLEAADPDAARAHVQLAADAGVPVGLMFSSVSSLPTPFGPAWVDAHLQASGLPGALPGSLLTAGHVDACLRAAGTPAHLGFKIGVHPETLTAHERLAHLDAMAALVAGG